jgi:hypothetical protein
MYKWYRPLARGASGGEIAILIMLMTRGGIIRCILGVSLSSVFRVSTNTIYQVAIVFGFKDFRARRIGFLSLDKS